MTSKRSVHSLAAVALIALSWVPAWAANCPPVRDTTPEFLSSIGTSYTAPAVVTALAADGTQYVFTRGILYRGSGGAWTSHAVSPVSRSAFAVVPDGAGTVHLIHSGNGSFWHTACPGDLADGLPCPAGQAVAPMYSGNNVAPASMVIDADGTLHLVMNNWAYTTAPITYSQRVSGGSWTAPVRIYPASGYGPQPYESLVARLDPDGYTLHIAGGNYTNSYYPFEVFYGRRAPGGTWTFETVNGDGPVWGKMGLGLDGADVYVCYGATGSPSSLRPLKVAHRDAAAVWTTETVVNADADPSAQGYGVDCDVFNGTLYLLATSGTMASGGPSTDDYRPQLFTRELPGGEFVYHGLLGGAANTHKNGVALAVADTVSAAWTKAPNAYVLSDLPGFTTPLPLACAGPDQTVVTGALVALDGQASSDPQGDPLTFSWLQTGGIAATLSDPASAQPTFVAPGVSLGGDTLTYEVTVNDGASDSAPDGVRVTVLNDGEAVFTPHVGDGAFIDGRVSDGDVCCAGDGSLIGWPYTNSLSVGSTGSSTIFRGFVGFDTSDLSRLGGDPIQQITLRLFNVQGAPAVGSVLVDVVDFGGSLDYADFDAPATVANVGSLPAVPSGVYEELDVTAAAATDVIAGKVQFRLRAEVEPVGNTQQNIVYFADTDGGGLVPQLIVSSQLPGCGVDTDNDGTADCHDGCPNDPNKVDSGICGCGVSDIDADADGTADCHDACPTDPNKTDPGLCDCGASDIDSDLDGTADCYDACPADPYKIAPGICGCDVSDADTDVDGTPDCNDGCPADPDKIAVGTCGCGVSDVDTDLDGTADCDDGCPTDAAKTMPGICDCWVSDLDTDADGTADCEDHCPTDPNKIAAGVCGCGVSDTDSDNDGTADCNDGCPADPEKIAAGICGCGASDVDSDGDGAADCNDGCATDPNKTEPGICGCGVSDVDSDGDGTSDCDDGCATDPNKTEPGICGCGASDVDSDSDGAADCDDGCVDDANKVDPGICGCGTSDIDSDGDSAADCNDACSDDPDKTAPGVCGCGVSDVDGDGDGTVDCNDGCPADADKVDPGICGCGVSDTDGDGDGVANCNDGCPADANKVDPGICGCGTSDVDSDLDGTADCGDGCPNDPDKIEPGVCGCGVSDADTNGDGLADCLNNPPVANAGSDQTVDEGVLVTLNGSGSNDPDGPPLTYLWSQVAGPSVTLDGTAESPIRTFTAPWVSADGATLTFQLVVDDGLLQSSASSANVTVKNVNKAPVADASEDQTVNEGSPVQLDASSSFDPDAEPVAFSWDQLSGPAVELADSDTATPTFTAPPVGADGATLTFEVTVSDGIDMTTDTVDVIVENVNHAPMAHAGENQTVDEGTLVTLNGSASGDPDADELAYSWTQLSGATVALSDPAAESPAFVAPEVAPGGEELTFQLVVNDGLLASAPDQVTITVLSVNDPPACELARMEPATLWPPNHKMLPVGIVGVTDPNNDTVTIVVDGVTQDEPIDGLGDGDTSPDAALLSDGSLTLRAERAGGGDGRVYRIEFTADDGVGGVCTGSVEVCVPQRAKGTCRDDEQTHYDSEGL